MRRPRLLNLLARNAKRGEFRAEAGSNTLFLYDVIVGSDEEAEWFGGVAPGSFMRQLMSLSGPVHLRINSPGGDVFAATAMAQAMREYPDKIIVHVDGLAASAATFLAISGAKTIMAPGSFMMIHRASTLAWGNAEDLASTATLLDKVDSTIAEKYAAKTGKDAAQLAGLMALETWFTDQEAIDIGLADELAGEKADGAPSARWDLAAFDHAPSALSNTPAPAAADPPQAPTASADEHDIDQRRRHYAARELISRS